MNARETDKSGPKLTRIGIVAVPGFALMSYACTVEPFRAANLLSGRTLYQITHFGEVAALSSGAAQVPPDLPVGAAPDLDLLLVIAGGDPFGIDDADMIRWLRRMAASGTVLGGVSGGGVVLVKAGLMAGRRMCVHWEHADELAEIAGEAILERKLYVIDRDRVTCGGGTSPLDLMLALIARDHGAMFAQSVSDWFLHTQIRAAAAPQRAGVSEALKVSQPHLAAAVTAMQDHIADPLSLDQLALIAGVSERHLARTFREAFAQSPMAYYRRLRLETAQRLLRGSGLSVGKIAEAVGFASPAHFSTLYRNAFGLRPAAERKALAKDT